MKIDYTSLSFKFAERGITSQSYLLKLGTRRRVGRSSKITKLIHGKQFSGTDYGIAPQQLNGHGQVRGHPTAGLAMQT